MFFFLKARAIMAASSKTVTVNRSAKSGQFVTEKYAKSHPATTEREHYRVPAPPPAQKHK
jgi:hypothetical protein